MNAYLWWAKQNTDEEGWDTMSSWIFGESDTPRPAPAPVRPGIGGER